LVEANTSDEVAPFHPFIRPPLNEFYSVKPLDDHFLPLEYKPAISFDMSCDEYIEIFNKLMNLGLIHSIGLRKRLLKISRTLICLRDVVHLTH